jgi:signal transduction histidine kinase
VSGDREVLERVLWNLLDNALKYTPQNGSIAVAARELVLPSAGRQDVPKDVAAGRWLLVEVVDSGVGIPPEERERIFGRFTQGRRGPVRRRGVGLGLAFCRLAVEAHGGRIWVEGQHGKGSAFSFVLPVATADALAQE